MQEISGLQLHRSIRLPVLINQERKSDAGLFAKLPGIDAVSQTNCGQRGPFIPESLGVFAQLRDVRAAKNSSIVAEENNDSRLFVPKGTEPYFAPIAICE